MSAPKKSIIDPNTEFPHLPNAPIVEAVLHWKAVAGRTLDKETVQSQLRQRFPKFDCKHQQRHQLEAAIQKSSEKVELRHHSRWDGFRLSSQDPKDLYVVQFGPNGVVFSHLAKYTCWETFQAEGLRFWDAYLELAEPPVIERLGVRFINQIQLGADGTPAEFLKDSPTLPKGMGLSSDQYFHQNTFRVTGYPYQIHWVRTVQRNPQNDRVLIVDCEVSTGPNKLPAQGELLTWLAEMRFLKNKLFFTCMTGRALKQFGKDQNGRHNGTKRVQRSSSNRRRRKPR